MKSVKTRCYLTMVQIVILLCGAAFLSTWYKDFLWEYFQVTQSSHLGIILNGIIIGLFLIGLLRIIWLLLDFIQEQTMMDKFVARVGEGVANPTYNLAPKSWLVTRFQLVSLISRQHGILDQSAMASTLNASISSQFTLVRFVNNTLILGGVFGTIVSLSMALVGAAKLLDAPENMQQMGTIIGGMSTALNTTVTAIVCFVIFAYLHLRLQDSRTQLLANLEHITMAYILPRFQSPLSEGQLMKNIAVISEELRNAAKGVSHVQDRFIEAGEHLQQAAEGLQEHIKQGSAAIEDIRDAVREGFRLPPRAASRVVQVRMDNSRQQGDTE